MLSCMSGRNGIRPDQGSGSLTVTDVHFAEGVPADLAGVMSFRFRDEIGATGQCSRARLALHIENGGHVLVGVGERRDEVEVDAERRVRTLGFDEAHDPILGLPNYQGHLTPDDE